MAITNDSKQALKAEQARLDDIKAKINQQIDELDLKKAKLVARRQEINQAITAIKLDIDNG